MLPDEILATLNDRYPCRELQIRSLAALYHQEISSPPTLVIHGPDATGKSSIVKDVLRVSALPHAIVDCRECVTGRHLLERTVASCLDALDAYSDTNFDTSRYSRCENISALAVHLQTILEGRRQFVLAFDGIDKQREPPPTLFSALARFGEILQIPNLSIILTVTVARPRQLHSPGIPHLYFPPYTRDESIRILGLDPPAIFTRAISPSMDYTEEEALEDNAWVWGRFCGVVWDSLAKGAARDIVSFRAICDKLWRPFVSSIDDGTFGTRDFSRLMVAKRGLFQGDDALVDKIIPKTAGEGKKATSHALRDLPYYSKYLLCAAYLASFNPVRQDQVFFLKSHEKKRRRKGGAVTTARASKHRRIPRHLLNPSPFPLDRLLAILHAILPDPPPQVADIQTQIATLTSLRLLQRTGASGDVLDPGCKWRVNFGWDYVQAVGRNVGFEIAEWVSE
ncbi:hypothetical protein NA57DRAFT_57751 [Rhizodiscina lignyota]|uniref:Orc1-like AAA ATPase domain-containing protein n=1 Tax=Rhizodiscina lignyota TaxID=1504668 RepID=A0A9P4M3W7_9PEZI|nr:hypothetical protein NA57DRAFT_57751 [Rhizodiscina lignyota]